MQIINGVVLITDKLGGVFLKYALKPNIHMTDFSLAVNLCEKDVTFETQDGDVLNLKSEFSKYVFLALALDPRDLESSRISCSPQDAALLSDYLVIP